MDYSKKQGLTSMKVYSPLGSQKFLVKDSYHTHRSLPFDPFLGYRIHSTGYFSQTHFNIFNTSICLGIQR